MTTQQFSAKQRRVIDDPRMTLLGIDERGRPVVEGPVGIPQRTMRWALTRDGEPIDIVGEIGKVAGPLARACPTCDARPGALCTTADGDVLEDIELQHVARQGKKE